MLINGSQIRFAMIAMVLSLLIGSANAQDDPSQRPLPLPERGVTDLPQHMELLKRLRSLVESQQKNSERPAGNSDILPRLPELPSAADSNSTPQKANETAPEPSSFQPQQLQQLQDALKNLASKLPPGFVPPDLSSVPPDQLRKAMENPAVQQQMKQMLEQFAKDGVLPKPGTNGSQLPVPPQNDAFKDPSQNNVSQNDGTQESVRKNEPLENQLNGRPAPSEQNMQRKSSTDSPGDPAEGDVSSEDRSPKPGDQNSEPKDSAASDSDKDAPPGSLRSLRSFLKKLAEDAGMKSPEPSTDSSPRNDTAPSNSSENEPDSSTATDEQARPAEPKNSLGNNSVPSTRRPLRKRDSAKPKTSPPADSSNSSAPGTDINPSEQFPEISPEPSNPLNALPRADDPQNTLGDDAVGTNPASQKSSPSDQPQGLSIEPEIALKQLEGLQKTIERMKQVAEESDAGRSPTEELPTPNGQADRSGSNNSDRSSDSNSVAPSTGRNNRMAERPDSDNRNGDQLPESLPNVDEFLREQLKNFKLSPDAVPGNKKENSSGKKISTPGMDLFEERQTNPNRTPLNYGGSRHSVPHDLYMERTPQPEEIQRLKNTQRRENTEPIVTDPSALGNAKSDKPPIDIAKELEQRGFGNTLKQLVERAKEEAKKPRQPVPNPADAEKIDGNTDTTLADIEKISKDATGAAKKADPELSKSMAKMLDGLKDDLVKIAKDAKFNDPPERSRGDRSMNRPSPAESNSMIDTLRKSASEILAGPTRSSNSGNSAASSAAAAASNAFSGEFDFTPVLVLAGVLAALAIAFFGLRHFKFRTADAAEFQFAGPPLKPADINSRADVVRAFHEFALRSAQSVQSWWTHRTVQQAILEKAPEYRAAVETLANTYEQARYLPAEQELSPEQLESARSALQQCSRKNSHS